MPEKRRETIETLVEQDIISPPRLYSFLAWISIAGLAFSVLTSLVTPTIAILRGGFFILTLVVLVFSIGYGGAYLIHERKTLHAKALAGFLALFVANHFLAVYVKIQLRSVVCFRSGLR